MRRGARRGGRKSIEPTVHTQDVVVSEDRHFLNPSAVSIHLNCPICHEVFVNPYRAPCGHTFCKECIFKWRKVQDICPSDRKKLGELHHDFIIESVIGDFNVACPWRALGCDFVGPLNGLLGHRKSCSFNPEDLPVALRQHAQEILSSAAKRYSFENVPKTFSTTKKIQRSASLTISTQTNKLNSGSMATSSGIESSDLTNSESTSVAQDGVVKDTSFSVSLCGDDDDDEDDDDLSHLPKVQPPSLLMRLYNKSDAKGRDLICNFLEGPPTDLFTGTKNATTSASRTQPSGTKRPHSAIDLV